MYQPMYYNMPRSIEIPPSLHFSSQQQEGKHNHPPPQTQQQQQQLPPQFHQQPTMAPFDMTYGQSMIPSNLLISSPYFTPPPSATQYFPQQPPLPPQSTSSSSHHHHHHHHHHNQYTRSSNSRNGSQSTSPSFNHSKLRHYETTLNGQYNNNNNHHNHHHHKKPTPFLTSVTNEIPSSINHSLDQLSFSRTIIFKNISPDISMHEFLNVIDFGPIEYCKMFSKPTPKSTREKFPEAPKNMQICYLSFSNNRIAHSFYMKYGKNIDNLNILKENLHDSKYLRLQLNHPITKESFSSTNSNNNSNNTTANNQDFIKLKTLNYILESNATRCVNIVFQINDELFDDGTVESRFDEIKVFIMTQCEKFGDVEDFELHIDTEDPNETDDEKKTTLSGNCVVHFCSIDSAIRTYESYLRRIQHDVQRDADTEATEEEDADEDKDKTDVNKKYSIKFIKAKFGKDRCDRTEIETIKNDQESTEESTTPIEGPLNSSTELKSFITSPEIERTPNGLNIADPISPNSSDIEASPLKSPLTNPENDLESTALSNVDYSIGSSSSRFPNNPAFVPVPYVLSNPLMSHSNASLISTHSCDGSSYGNRSIYLGNLHPKTTVEEIANNVRAGGLVESINYHPDRRVCFITFIDANVAYKFYMNHQVLHQLVIHGYDVTVGWAKQQVGQLNRDIALAVTAGASRNVYIGIKVTPNSIKKETDSKMPIPIEDELRQDFSNFGSLEQINFIHNKECGFMNFLHIIDAIRVVSIFEQGPTEAIGRLKKVFPLPDEAERFYNKYKDYKISFAKDRCGNSPKFSFKKRLPEEIGNIYYQSNGSSYSHHHHYEHNHHHHHNNYEENGSGATKNGSQRETDEFNKETIADETAMVFGIVSQTDANKSTELVDVPEVNEDEDDEKTLEEKELEVQKDEAMEAKDEGKDDVEEEEDDDDDEEEEEEEEVSIIIGSDETTSTTQKKPYHHPYRPRPRYQKIYHSNHSEPSFRRSSSNLSLNSSIPFNQSTGQYPHPVYYLPHLSRTNSATSFRSYGNHHQPQQPQQVQPTTTYLIPQTAPPLQYYGNAVVPQQVPPPPPPPNSASASATPQIRYVPIMPLQVPPPPGSTPYISSGSQVMAQYLAKSQQDHQMMYGMTPTPMPMTMPMYPAMNVDESFNDAYSYTSSRRSAGPYRRGSFKK